MCLLGTTAAEDDPCFNFLVSIFMSQACRKIAHSYNFNSNYRSDVRCGWMYVCKTKLGRWVELAGGSADPAAAAPMVWNSNWMWNGESEKDSFALLYNIAQTQLCGALPQPRQQWEASKSGKLCGAGCIRINVSSDVSRNAMYTQSSHMWGSIIPKILYLISFLPPPTPENLNHPCQYTSLDTWLIVFETLFQHAAAAPSAAAAPLPSAARDDVLQPFMLVLPGLSSLLIVTPCQPATPHHTTALSKPF